MNIVLEGPDASGKSTLANAISTAFSKQTDRQMPIISSEGPEKYPGEIDKRIERYLKLDNVIFDRHPVVSQPIYCQFNGTRPPSFQLAYQFYASNPLFIYCARDSKSSLDNHVEKAHDTNEHIKAITKNDGEIVQLYEDWAMQHAHMIHRIGQSTVLNFLIPLLSYCPNMTTDIWVFHNKFGLEYDGKPRFLPNEMQVFRSKFMQEELNEYVEAVDNLGFDPVGNLEKALDSLVDLVYVALGTAHLHGFDFDEAWRRVHRANMMKVRVERIEDSSRGSTLDVVKPPGWKPPSHRDLVT